MSPAFAFILLCIIRSNEAIIGGRNASSNQFPYIVSLQNTIGVHVNAGTIISRLFVVTDAYTLHPNRERLQPSRILAGTNLLQGPGMSYRIKQITIHPRYDEGNYLNNIGLVQIDGQFLFTSDDIQPIPLGIVKIGPSVPVIAAGWGNSQNSVRSIRTRNLQFATLLTVSNYETNRIFQNTFFEENDDYMHAFGYGQSGAMTCEWDMGGPITAGYTLVGIITWDTNRTCSYQNPFPSTALRIEPLIGWINDVVYNSEVRQTAFIQ